MYKGKHIILFVVLFCLLALSPFLANAGTAPAAPEPSLDTPEIGALAEKSCIEPTDYMRGSHMVLLDEWRTAVVRDGKTEYTASSGQVFEMSLDETCLGCHSNREEFCDSCHTYASTSLYCWDCHDAAAAAPQG